MVRFVFCTLRLLLLGGLGMAPLAIADEPVAADPPANASGSAAAAPTAEASKPSEPAAGHSMHGEAFNEGPRQAAYLMEGMGNIQFDVSTSHPEAKKFFVQGVAQLHGFWYYEAERSFRQAAMLDPNCAMCYWGMALANVNNRKRAEAFATQAVKLREGASERERMYIDAADRRFKEKIDGKKPSKKETAERYTRDLEELVLKFPEDVEARAFLALQLWENERSDLPITSHVAINAVLQDVFDKNPMHPAHHYRIHLWDRRNPAQALASAALCGPSLPGIAHMWHMPGHTYSNLNRFQDAVWQQEASARVDHAHMMRDRVLPDQIHNFAHNNEWMIRNLLKIGRINDAVSLASNMIELPRHPKYNTLKSGSAKYGRERLLQSLSSYRHWADLVRVIDSGLIEPGEDAQTQIETLRHLGIAQAMLDQADDAQKTLGELKSRLASVQKQLDSLTEQPVQANVAAKPDEGKPPAPDNAEATSSNPASPSADAAGGCQQESAGSAQSTDNSTTQDASPDAKKAEANRKRRDQERADQKKELEPRRKQLTEAIAAIDAVAASRAGKWNEALQLCEKAGTWDKLLKAEWLAKSEQFDKACEIVDAEVKSNPGSILPGAVSAFVRWQSRGSKEASAAFDTLREAACTADLSTPLLSRLGPLAVELGYGEVWAKPYQPKPDVGPRPPLDSLGPFRYSPYTATAWEAKDRDGQSVSSNRYGGKPVVVIFYLGFGCLHCVEQLQAFSPMASQFRSAGIELVAISTETCEELAKGLDAYAKPLSIPLLADPQLHAFKSYRCIDDFEKKPLHGTFLVDAQGRVLWQDISFEPFKDTDFMLKESQRLLKVPRN